MFLVVGLGNPGREYESTRHNAGFLVVDEIRRSLGLPDFKEKFSGVWTKGDAWGESIALLKPMTFMNLSGESVQPCAAFLKVPPGRIVVLHDEIDLPFADVRVKVGGGHAGHNGLRSIIQRLGTNDFVRVRIGVGKPPAGFRGEVADWVLSGFDAVERAEWPDVAKKAASAVQKVVQEGPAAAMNVANARAAGGGGKPGGGGKRGEKRDAGGPARDVAGAAEERSGRKDATGGALRERGEGRDRGAAARGPGASDARRDERDAPRGDGGRNGPSGQSGQSGQNGRSGEPGAHGEDEK